MKDNTSRALSDDFSLWLFFRCEGNQELIADELHLGLMQALSSVNSNKSARFRDGASLDRIELVSMIAVSAGKFGPARFSIDAESPSTAFELELHLDGGFQPMRTSERDDSQKEGADKGVHLIEDLRVSVLPRLRTVYEADGDWHDSGREELREQCLSAVGAALDTALARAGLGAFTRFVPPSNGLFARCPLV